MDLQTIEQQLRAYFDSLLAVGQPYGAYAAIVGGAPDFYASLDVALARVIMGEDLRATVSNQQRQEWMGFINSYAKEDGSYRCFNGHSALHANGMVIGALGPLGGKQRYAVSLYDDIKALDQIGPWLEAIDWSRQWSASHLFWGGMHCYSMREHCSPEWKATVFNWLDAEIDPRSGWWRKGVVHSDRHQGLGGAVHILPIYEHARHRFPYPEALIDSVLAMQLENYFWHADCVHGLSYLELDALYVYAYTRSLNQHYRRVEVDASVERYADRVETYWLAQGSKHLETQHPHHMLAVVGIFGLLQQLLPNRFLHERQWTDIFSDPRLYQTDLVSAS